MILDYLRIKYVEKIKIKFEGQKKGIALILNAT